MVQITRFGLFVIVITLYVHEISGCFLRYREHVRFKPLMYVATKGASDICRIKQDQNDSSFSLNISNQLSMNYKDLQNWTGGVKSLSYDFKKSAVFFIAYNSNEEYPRQVKVGRYTLKDDMPTISIIFDTSSLKYKYHNSSRDITSTAYDYVSKYMYLTNGEYIWVLDVQGGSPPKVRRIFDDGEKIENLAVHPHSGLLFFTDRNKIYRAYSTGSSLSAIKEDFETKMPITNLVVDSNVRSLYWSTLQKIGRVDFDGRRQTNLTIPCGVYNTPFYSARSIAVDLHYIYYRPLLSDSIVRLFKSNWTKDTSFELMNNQSSGIIDIMIFDPFAQILPRDNLCKRKSNYDSNKDCEHFCFVVPKNQKKCACERGYHLSEDGRTCLYANENPF